MTGHEEPVPNCPREQRTGADGLAIPHNAKLPPVGSTVDVESATWTNTIGDAL